MPRSNVDTRGKSFSAPHSIAQLLVLRDLSATLPNCGKPLKPQAYRYMCKRIPSQDKTLGIKFMDDKEMGNPQPSLVVDHEYQPKKVQRLNGNG